MPPTLVSSSSLVYNSIVTPRTHTVTTQAGDLVVVYGGTEDLFGTLGDPSGNSISFTLHQSIAISGHTTAYVWSGIDSTGGTNWTLTCSATNTRKWGTTCLVFRNATAGASAKKSSTSIGAGSVDITTTKDHSTVIVYIGDWDAGSGASRTWLTVSGVTPTSGNGLELNYMQDATAYSIYAAMYNDTGTAGLKTVGLSVPNNQTYSVVSLEIKGPDPAPIEGIPVAWFTA